MKHINWQLELIIVDNGSQDLTPKIISKFYSSLKNEKKLILNCIKNSTNEGFNSSCNKIIKQATGKYLWVLGAQEHLLPKSLSYLKPYLDRRIDHILLNSEVWNSKKSQVVDPNYLKATSDAVWHSRKSFFKFSGGPHGCISNNIAITQNLKKVSDYYLHSHLWGMYERHIDAIINSANQCYERIAKPLFKEFIDENHWSRGTLDFFGSDVIQDPNLGLNSILSFNEITVLKYKKYRFVSRNTGLMRNSKFFARFIVDLRLESNFTTRNLFSKTFRIFRSTKEFWLICAPLLLLPRFFLLYLNRAIKSRR